MKINSILIFLVFSASFTSAQNTIPLQNELYGKWVIKRNINNPEKIYLLESGLLGNVTKYGVELFTGEFTGKRKIKFFYSEPPRENKIRRCLNDGLNQYRGTSDAVWQYDSNNGILKVFHSKFLGGTLFEVEKENSSKLILIKI